MKRWLLAALLAAGCVTYTAGGKGVRIEHAFDATDHAYHADPFAGRCRLVRAEENGALGRRLFGPVDASNYAATIGANSIYWWENGAEKIREKLEKCGMVQNMNYGHFGLAASEIECRGDSGAIYRIPQYRATLKFYACAPADKPTS